jgi:tRNA-Thr(GGU) m(6)t(6)A37 methyltransferase TsaA
MSKDFIMRTVGFVRSPYSQTSQIPKGFGVQHQAEGTLEILPEYELGLTTSKASRICMCSGCSIVPTVTKLLGTPPTDTTPHGVFATRSPKRPNPIGLTVVKLIRRDSLTLHVAGLDMMDGTPILDIKPYLSNVSEGDLRRGWLDEAEARHKPSA